MTLAVSPTPSPTSAPIAASPGSPAPAPKYDFDREFQTKIAAMTMRDGRFMGRTDGLIQPQYFENQAEAGLVSLASDYYRKYKRLPADWNIYSQTIKEAVEKRLLRREDVAAMVVCAKKLYATDISDREFVVDSVATFARHQAVVQAMTECIGKLDMRDFGFIQKKMNQALMVGATGESEAYNYKTMIDNRTAERKDIVAGIRPPSGISTGYKDFDDCLYHQGWGKGELSILMGGAKAGKCVTRDTLLLTEDGMVEIGDYVPRNLGVGEFLPKEISLLGRHGIEKSSAVYNSGLSKTIRATTNKGFVIEGTYQHPMLVLDKNGDHTWKQLSELEKGDFMVAQRGARMFGKHTDLHHAVNATKARILSSKHQLSMTSIRLPESMTPDLAEFLGMLVAEGYCGAKGRLSFTQKDTAIMSRYVDLCGQLFGLSPSIQDSNGSRTPSAIIQNVALQAYLEALGFVWGKSAVKVMPYAVRRAPESSVRAFVSAVIGLEGHVSKLSSGKITFDLAMASDTLVRQLQIAMLNFGVVARRCGKKAMATNGARITRQYWRLTVSGTRNIAMLRDNIGVYESRKQLLLHGDFKDSTARDWIPNASEKIAQIMLDFQSSGHSLKSSFTASEYRSLRTFRSGRAGEVRELTYSFAECLLQKIDMLEVRGEGCDWLRDILKCGYCYDAVTTLEFSEAETVDLTVPESHSFFANGLISHNTTALMQFGLNACTKGAHVLYVTLEVSAKILGARCDANISNTAFKDLKSNIIAVHDKVKSWSASAGNFIVEEYPTGTMTCSDLRRIIERWKARGITFDMVIVDYADIMSPERHTDSLTENSKSVYVGLRAIAMQEQVALLSATQTNREGFKSQVAKAEHVAEDFNKIRIADVIISINANEDEIKVGEARLYFAACRNQAGGFSIRVTQDREKMIFVKTVIGRE